MSLFSRYYRHGAHTQYGMGVTAEIVGTLLIITSLTVLKFYNVGTIIKLALVMLAMFLPYLLVVLGSMWSARNTTRGFGYVNGERFTFQSLFTNKHRLLVGVFTLGYFLFTYSSYSLLPLSIAMPIYVTYPVIDILLSPLINNRPWPTWKQWCGIGLLIIGIGTFLYDAFTIQYSHNLSIGVVLGVLGAVFIALRMIYTKDRPILGAPVRGRDSPTDAPPPTVTGKVEEVGVKMLETSTIGVIVFATLACFVYSMPSSWRKQLIGKGVPE